MRRARNNRRAGGSADRLSSLLALHEVALETMSHGLCLYDAELRVALFNQRFLASYNLAGGVVRRGTTMREVFRHGADRLGLPAEEAETAWLRRQEQLARGEPFSARHQLPDGRVIALNFRPMPDGGWIAVYEDVTVERRMQQELRLQFDRMNQALRHLPHGLSMFDADERLVVCNQQYLAIYDLDPDIIRPGVTHREIIANWIARGNQPGVAAGDLDRKSVGAIEDGSRTMWLSRKDGRVIEAVSRATPGGGWVTISEDITSRLRAEEALREQNLQFDAALENMAQGLCMLDRDLRLLVCNRRFLDIYGFNPAVVKPGISLMDLSRHSVALGNHRDASPERVCAYFRRKLTEGQAAAITYRRADGRSFAVRSQPMANGGWVVTFEDMTAREQAAHALREQNLRFDAALNNMSRGLAMFDADQRLIVCNDKYMTLFGADPDVVKPGITLRGIFEHCVARGLYPGLTTDQLLARRLTAIEAQQPTIYDQEVMGGRTLSIAICPMANGGWVATFEDITESRKLEAERTAALADLQEQHRRFDAALNNMSHGLCMIDENLRIIVCNRHYLDIFGFSPDIAKPGAPMRDVLAHSLALGNYPCADLDQVYRDYLERLKEWPVSVNLQLADRRVILIIYRPMPHGGWVATYEDVTERREAEQRISHMARHDALTDLPNRVLFREKMADGLARVEAGGESLAVLCLDLDNFKTVNDTLGHPMGDRLLSTVAQRLVCVVGEGDTIARLGGDEFAILQAAPHPHAAETLARRIVEVLDQPVVIDGHEINTGVSIGIAVAPKDGVTADQLMKCADLALYRAKAEGRAGYRFFEPTMDTRLRERRELELDLRKALANGEFALLYQPQLRAADSALTGMEALLRWTHGERGPVPPAEFIPIAEETGLIVPLGEWVLRRACAEAARWPDLIKVAVNLSPVQFKGRGLVATVASALASAGLPAHRLELEITEAVLLQDEDTTLAMLHQLRALGVRISMDDFGTGYSSLSYLRSFPFDKIKIDRCFVSDLARNKDSAAIIRAVASLGASLGIETTAEGVETAEQLDLVRRNGCTEVQGFYFSPARPAEEVLARFAKGRRQKAVA